MIQGIWAEKVSVLKGGYWTVFVDLRFYDMDKDKICKAHCNVSGFVSSSPVFLDKKKKFKESEIEVINAKALEVANAVLPEDQRIDRKG